MSDTKSQIQETQRTPTRINDKKEKQNKAKLNVGISFQATEKSKIKKYPEEAMKKSLPTAEQR